jgi:hypothetical protein
MDITDMILEHKDMRYGRRFQIGDPETAYTVLLSFNDQDENPYIQFGEHCSAEQIAAILNYANRTIPSFTEIRFQDTSNFLAANKRTYTRLYAFSIAFNGASWYEHHLNARHTQHAAYRNAVERMMFSEEYKAATTYRAFLYQSAFAFEVMDELEPYYEAANTFNAFFQSLPTVDRERLTSDWIHEFMKYHLGNDICGYNTEWIIPLPIITMENANYYYPTTDIRHTPLYNTFGLDVSDI